ncbi:MAG: CBS domain-containing protein [Bacteroidetes bacterium]|nr:CBS domain-containing protein [Bacteroidota bacterium]
MKISASIYSDGKRPLKEVIEDLNSHQVDLLHVDCNDDFRVFSDIQEIRKWTNTPIDLHIITENPEKYFNELGACPVEFVTFQFEQLPPDFKIPSDIKGKKGLAVITPTPVSVFEKHQDFDFILIMATIPGQSGGKFDALNFSKIRQFRNQFPGKSIHVDGGVNGEVSFILRNMGVACSVSGSYLFKAPSVGHALMDLTNREHSSEYRIADFMIPYAEAPVVMENELSVSKLLQTVEDGKLGFCLICDSNQKLIGLTSNADIRRGFLKHTADFNLVEIEEFINRKPTALKTTNTVIDMMKLIRSSTFPISYLPVVDDQNVAKGIITFVNLIKGEL